MKNEIKQLKEEIAKLRERVAILESKQNFVQPYTAPNPWTPYWQPPEWQRTDTPWNIPGQITC